MRHEVHEADTNVDGKILYRELSYLIVGCAMQVHKKLGLGFPEAVYERALEAEFEKQRVGYERQKPFVVRYEEKTVGNFRADFVVENKIVLELKALPIMPGIFLRQWHSYLQVSGLRLGILTNFGRERLEYHRIVY
jgi:GxxExxY protein